MLATALELVDAEGLEALSMRRLGNELGRVPMGLYRYAENRADLLGGITELVLEKLAIPTDAADPTVRRDAPRGRPGHPLPLVR